MDSRTAKAGNQLQTLRRGMEAISLVAECPEGLSVAQLAERLNVDRAIAYRIVATLEADSFVSRGPDGRIYLGGAILALASGLEPQLRAVVEPALRRLAEETRATAFMSVARGSDAVAILVAESNSGLIRVGYRTGSRHPLNLGAAGIAILAGRPGKPDDPEAVRVARKDGYSVTRGELQRGAVGVAAPVRFSKQKHAALEASVGVVALDDLDVDDVTPRVIACAQEVSRFLVG